MAETTISPTRLAFTLVYLLIYPALTLWLSGDWRWPEGWLFSTWFTGLCATTILYLYRHDPALLAERYQRPGAANQVGWDVYFIYGFLLAFVAWWVIMPLDAQRFAWSGTFPVWLKGVGGIALLVSAHFFFRAFKDNTFLSPLVRIQQERQHQVVSTGVYATIRHPMYLGALLMFLGAPLLLGSVWGLALGLALTLLLAGRIIGEERVLTRELPGYAAYRERVRYRLVPFVW